MMVVWSVSVSPLAIVIVPGPLTVDEDTSRAVTPVFRPALNVAVAFEIDSALTAGELAKLAVTEPFSTIEPEPEMLPLLCWSDPPEIVSVRPEPMVIVPVFVRLPLQGLMARLPPLTLIVPLLR